MKGLRYSLLASLVIIGFCLAVSPQLYGQTGSLVRRLIGAEDISFATGGTGAVETFQYADPSHNLITLHKLDAAYIKFRTVAGSLEDLVSGSNSIDLKAGNVGATGDLSVAGTAAITGTTTITGLTTFGTIPVGPAADPTTANQLTRKSYVDTTVAALSSSFVALTGNQTVAGIKTFTSFSVTPSTAPTTDYQAANKKYVDDAFAAVQPIYSATLQNRRAQNTGGGTATSGSWLIVPLNTEYEDANTIVDSTSLPAFSLGAGTYYIEASCPFYATGFSQARLYNVSDTAVQVNINSKAMIGSSVSPSSINGESSLILGTFTIAATKQLRIEYRVYGTKATVGLGNPSNLSEEIYAQVKITKIQ